MLYLKLSLRGAMMDFLVKYKDAFTSIGTIIALAIFAFGLYQFWRSERWKKNEFIAKAFRDMADDLACQRAMLMLDWDEREINFGSHEEPKKQKYKRAMLIDALRTRNLNLTELEMDIRDTFDRFFYFISLFERALQNRLISEQSVYPYLAYWIALLQGNRLLLENNEKDKEENKKVVDQIRHYVETYHFVDVQKLLDRRWPKSNMPAPSCGTVESSSLVGV
jgi:hypothetical protein